MGCLEIEQENLVYWWKWSTANLPLRWMFVFSLVFPLTATPRARIENCTFCIKGNRSIKWAKGDPALAQIPEAIKIYHGVWSINGQAINLLSILVSHLIQASSRVLAIYNTWLSGLMKCSTSWRHEQCSRFKPTVVLWL